MKPSLASCSCSYLPLALPWLALPLLWWLEAWQLELEREGVQHSLPAERENRTGRVGLGEGEPGIVALPRGNLVVASAITNVFGN